MAANSALRPISNEEQSLAFKLEYAILSVLIQYNGSYEESLPDWYAALRLGCPQLKDPRELRDVFERLSANGIIELNKPNSGSYRGGATDHPLFNLGTFTTSLTRDGLVHWNTVRIQAVQLVA